MWCMSARKPFPAPLNVVSKNVTLTAVHWTTTSGPSHCRFEESMKQSRYRSDSVCPISHHVTFRSLYLLNFCKGLLWLQFQLFYEFEPRWMKTFHSLGLKAKNKRTEWYQLIQPVTMYALLHQNPIHKLL